MSDETRKAIERGRAHKAAQWALLKEHGELLHLDAEVLVTHQGSRVHLSVSLPSELLPQLFGESEAAL